MAKRNLIVAKFNNTNVIIDKKLFDFQEVCSTYDKYGQQIDCHDAGCYSLNNFSSVAIESFKQILREVFSMPERLDFSIENKLNAEGVRFFYVEFEESTNISPETKDKVNDFINSWEENNSRHYKKFSYTYWDGSNWKTVSLKPEQEDLDKISREEWEWVKYDSMFDLERIADREEENKIIEAFLGIEDELTDCCIDTNVKSGDYDFYYSMFPSFFMLASIDNDPFDEE
jgi:hypothetical protein